MTQPQVIKSVTLIVATSFVVAWLLQFLVYHFNIAEAICFSGDCPRDTMDTIITTSLLVAVFSSIYFIFLHPIHSKAPHIELSILLSCLVVNLIRFNNTNAYLCLIPYNVISVYSYYHLKKQMARPFKLLTFVIQELFLLLLLLCTYVYLDGLFVSKGLDREVIMYTGGEKMLDLVISILIWTAFFAHTGYLSLQLFRRKRILRKVIARSFNVG